MFEELYDYYAYKFRFYITYMNIKIIILNLIYYFL